MEEEKDKKEVAWNIPEFEYHQKDIGWYWMVAIAGIIITAIAVWQNNFLLAVFTVLAVLMAIVWGKRKPRMLECKLNEKKMCFDKKDYELKSFAGFFVNDKSLILKNKKSLSTYLKIPIKETDSETIKGILQNILPEIEYSESLIDALANWLRF